MYRLMEEDLDEISQEDEYEEIDQNAADLLV